MTHTAAEPPRPLPIRPRPMTGESTTSYIRRLARANHLRPRLLTRYLRGGPGTTTSIRLDWLAALSGRNPADLAKALTEFRAEHPPAPLPSPSPRRIPTRTSLFNAIRRDAHNNAALSTRSLSDRHGVHRRTIRAALNSPAPPPRKARPKRRSQLDPYQGLIDAMLTDGDATARGIIKQIHNRLVNEPGLRTMAYSSVRDYVVARRQHLGLDSNSNQVR
jgi:hypothetical protein